MFKNRRSFLGLGLSFWFGDGNKAEKITIKIQNTYMTNLH